MQQRLNDLESTVNLHTKLLFRSMETQVIMVAAEILKWSAKKGGVIEGDGQHLYDHDVQQLVRVGCCAYGEYGLCSDRVALESYKATSKEVIQNRNSVVHYENLEALEKAVNACTHAMAAWPQLAINYPNQTKIISQYRTYKLFLPDCFSDQ